MKLKALTIAAAIAVAAGASDASACTNLIAGKYATADSSVMVTYAAEDIQNHVKNVTAPYKYPRMVEYADELPETISGKTRRVEIRERDQKKVN